jgi:integrase
LLQRLIKLRANLYEPETVKEVIAKQDSWCEGRKLNAVKAYTKFLKWLGGNWDPPKYRTEEKLPFIPLEEEIDALISGCSPRISCFLQLLKETAFRPGEAWRLKWVDIDFVTRTVTLNYPEKRSKPRQVRISTKLVTMLGNLQRSQNPISERIFNYVSTPSLRRIFEKQRKRIAFKLGNPRILKITFKTFRHWKATMEYNKTKDILYVMQVLGHKNIKNTLRYTQLVNFAQDEYVCKVATTVKQASELIEIGYEYVCEIEDIKLFRKRK